MEGDGRGRGRGRRIPRRRPTMEETRKAGSIAAKIKIDVHGRCQRWR